MQNLNIGKGIANFAECTNTPAIVVICHAFINAVIYIIEKCFVDKRSYLGRFVTVSDKISNAENVRQ